MESDSMMVLSIFCRSEKAFLKLIMLLLAFRNASPHFLGCVTLERLLRKIATGREAQPAHLRFHRRDRRQADTQFIDAESDQNRNRVRITRDSTVNANVPLIRMTAFDRLRDQAQNRGIQSINFWR